MHMAEHLNQRQQSERSRREHELHARRRDCRNGLRDWLRYELREYNPETIAERSTHPPHRVGVDRYSVLFTSTTSLVAQTRSPRRVRTNTSDRGRRGEIQMAVPLFFGVGGYQRQADVNTVRLRIAHAVVEAAVERTDEKVLQSTINVGFHGSPLRIPFSGPV